MTDFDVIEEKTVKTKESTTSPTVAEINGVMQRATCLYTGGEVSKALSDMAKEISAQLKDSNPVVLCVMIGGVLPTGGLLNRLDFPLQVDYVHATRYGDKIVGETLEWIVTPRVCLKDRTVLIVDDILDGGITLTEIAKYCKDQGAKEVKTAVLVEKNVERAKGAIQKADFTGVTVENRYVFGFGMDYKRYLRNAPGIYVVAPEDQ